MTGILKYLFLLLLFLISDLTVFADTNRKQDSLLILIESQKDDAGKSSLYLHLANIYEKKHNIDSALYFYKRSYHFLNDTLGAGAGNILNEIGRLSYKKGDFATSLMSFKRSLRIAKAFKDSSAIAKRLSNIGVIYDYLGDYVQAIKYYQSALRIFELQNSTKGMAFIFNNLGVVSEELQHPNDALEYYKKALELKLAAQDTAGAANSMNNIGVVYEHLKEYDSSLIFYYKALEIFEKIDNKRRIATTYNNIGIIFRLEGNTDSAVFYINKALEINKITKNKDGELSYLLSLGRVYYDMGNIKKAGELYLKSLEIAKEPGNRKKIADIYKALAEYFNKTGRFQKAYEYQVRYTNLKDTLLNEANNKQIALLKTGYELEKKDKKLKILSQQNILQKQSIKKYNYLFIAIFLITLLIAIITVLLVRQNRLEDRQKTTELHQKLLRSQMNPHFIFNTLFSIQTYMLENDTISASRFLSRFAKLMRQILEYSKHEFIKLEDEMEFLNNYLLTQQLRFNESFGYEIIYNGDEDEKSLILVPPMLIQPLVENAIEHGVRNIDREGFIKIVYTINEKNLTVTVEDNGIGYFSSNEKENTIKNHKSTGLENTRSRIQMLNNKYKTKFIFEIKDLSNETPPRNGTIITFAIPLIFA